MTRYLQRCKAGASISSQTPNQDTLTSMASSTLQISCNMLLHIHHRLLAQIEDSRVLMILQPLPCPTFSTYVSAIGCFTVSRFLGVLLVLVLDYHRLRRIVLLRCPSRSRRSMRQIWGEKNRNMERRTSGADSSLYSPSQSPIYSLRVSSLQSKAPQGLDSTSSDFVLSLLC
ncbi:hypothetical protein DFH29DRAFT_617308 [Suillus ampliporus]|nr:hypothetical protein DFH29DRAFT_617308 [Suillus ampliporus]